MNAERITKSALIELGAKPHLKGFWHILDAVQIILKNNGQSVRSEDLYRIVAEKRGSTPQSVERGVRSVVVKIYDSGTWDSVREGSWFVPSYDGGQLPPKQFLFALADYVDHIMSKENDDESNDRDSEN